MVYTILSFLIQTWLLCFYNVYQWSRTGKLAYSEEMKEPESLCIQKMKKIILIEKNFTEVLSSHNPRSIKVLQKDLQE